MGMGIVSEAEFNLEKDKLIPPTEIEPISGNGKIIDVNIGRGNNPNVPDSLRKIIGETAISNGRKDALQIGKQFGISPSSVSAYTQGATSTATYETRPNATHLNDVKERISKLARNRLVSAIKGITPEKLADAKLKVLSGVARDMSAVIKNMEPDTLPNGSERPITNFIMYAPPTKDERSFESIQLKE